MLFKDQLNREIEIENTPERIISLVPSQTELLVDLGLKDRLVGVTKFCVHPRELKEEITIVGGTKTVHYDKIKSFEPDLIICNKEENTLEMVVTLEKIAPVYVSDIVTIEDSLEMIWQLGTLLGVAERASEIIDTISLEKEEFEKFVADQPQKKVAYLIWKNPYMAAGKETFIDSLLQLNKFQNIIVDRRYPEVSLEQLSAAEVVLLSTEPYPFKEEEVQELKEILKTKVRLVDGEYFSWYGSRLGAAFQHFKTLH